MRIRTLGDDFLDGCALDFEAAAVTDEEADALAATFDASFDPDALTASAAAAVSSIGRDLSIARRLRAAGLEVVEVDGWRSRGDAVHTPKGHVEHHTAGSSSGDKPSLAIVVNGRSDLSGPLANTFVGRDRKWYVVASGRANHAGSGGFKGLSGNSVVHGTEVEHVGTRPLPDDIVVILAIGTAAIAEGRWTGELVAQHHEWSSAGKIDIATNFHGAEGPAPSAGRFRSMVNARLAELADVKRSKIVFPINARTPTGAWRRKSVVVPTENVDKWIANHAGVLERRGRGGEVNVTAASSS
jgi:hypothetical protein